MSRIFVFLWMLFMHVLDDYVLQGVLANLKQKDWWKKNAPNPLYRDDYVVALLMHSISWTFCIMLPVASYAGFQIGWPFVGVFVGNVFIHGCIDHLKANCHIINLITDQALHVLVQIVCTFVFCVILGVI